MSGYTPRDLQIAGLDGYDRIVAEQHLERAARCPRTVALLDRCISAMPLLDDLGQAKVLTFIEALTKLVEAAYQVTDEEAGVVEDMLARLGAGK